MGLLERIRYDYWYGINEFKNYEEEVKAYMVDIGFYFSYSHVMEDNREWLINIGYTFNQVGKKKDFDLSHRGMNIAHALIYFQYSSFNYGVEYDFYKVSPSLYLSGFIVASYIRRGHPAYPWRDFMTLGVGVTMKYKPDFLQINLNKRTITHDYNSSSRF